ncbi:MAG: radical SAM family heme chaperone HemW [Firmicutes bacterium]|nr:radical SAM family heme chaperone HemW [Bacillota bacterium]
MKLGIYVHVPYCVRKCRYCDFESAPLKGREDTVAPYFEQLCRQIRRAGEALGGSFTVDSVFFGGGTPSVVAPLQLAGVMDALRTSFSVEEDCESSLEVNPGTLSEEKLSAYRAAGFNRISMGVQSFDDRVLQKMGRIHDSQEAIRSFALARRYFDNINLDLMMGVPGQDLFSWKATLQQALALSPEHLSFYSLQLEEGTPFYEDYRSGRLQLPSWEEDRRMYHETLAQLASCGYVHYEVSNAAKPGRQCRHNLKYWTMQPYLGFGSAAHSFLAGRRFEAGIPPILSSQEALRAAEESCCFSHFPDLQKKELQGDYLFTGLRLIEGLDKNRFEQLFGCSYASVYGEETRRLIEEGLLRDTGSAVAFTAAGLDQTNPVMERLLNL